MQITADAEAKAGIISSVAYTSRAGEINLWLLRRFYSLKQSGLEAFFAKMLSQLFCPEIRLSF